MGTRNRNAHEENVLMHQNHPHNCSSIFNPFLIQHRNHCPSIAVNGTGTLLQRIKIIFKLFQIMLKHLKLVRR